MMRNPEQTIGNLIDKQGVAFIASVDADGVPNMKPMLPPRKREGIHTFFHHQHLFPACGAIPRESKSEHIFLR
jgi:general stress protein 26